MGVPLSRRNLFHEKGKLALSVVGIGASLTLILLLLGFREGLYATLTAYVDNIGADIIVAQSGVQGMFSSNSALPMSLHGEAVEAANVDEAGHIIIADVIFTRDETKMPVLLVGYVPGSTLGSPWNISQGRPVTENDEILLDSWLAKRGGIALGDTVTVLDHDFNVVGLTRETASWMSPYIFVSLDAAESALGLNNIVSYHLLRLTENANVNSAITAIEDRVPGIDVLTPTEIADADRRVLATVMDTPLNVMLFIGVVIGVAVMGLTAYTAVTGQMREYGVLKAVGAGSGRIAWQVTIETLYRAVFGFILGVGMSYAAAATIMAIWPQFNIVIRPPIVAQAGGIAVGMTVLAALLPVRRLNQIDPMMVFKA